jgi:hypothetical protein
MFKNFPRDFVKFFTLEKSIFIIVAILLLWGISTYSYGKVNFIDSMTTGTPSIPPTVTQPTLHDTAAQNVPPVNTGYALQPVANPSDLLPVDTNAAWGGPLNSSFMTQGNIVMPDLLQAGYHIGLDTIGQSLRNPNYQERSDPIIPKTEGWGINMSTIEPDLGRIPLEVGYGCK